MRRWLQLKIPVLLLLSVLGAPRPGMPATGAGDGTEARDVVEMALLVEPEPKRLSIDVEVDGRSVFDAWEEAMTILLRHSDGDGDGTLDAREAERLPSPPGIRQLFWGVYLMDGPAPKWSSLYRNQDGRVGSAELSAFYRSEGSGPVLVGVGHPPHTSRLNEVLIQRLDTDQDGRLSRGELQAAEDMLGQLDRNGDERLAAAELVTGIRYPGTRATLGLSLPQPGDHTTKALPVPIALIPPRDEADRWVQALARSPGFPDRPEAVRKWRDTDPDHAWTVQLGQSPVEKQVSKSSTDHCSILAVGEWRSVAEKELEFHFRADEGTVEEDLIANRKSLLALFDSTDQDASGTLDPRELDDPARARLKLVLPWADRDRDGALSKGELNSWQALIETLARANVLISILDHGQGLFEIIDTDHDGALSIRELRGTANRVEQTGCLVEGELNLRKLPRTLVGCLSRGHPQHPLASHPKAGPEWFQGMDRNRDGDVSLREWVGDQSLFQKLDADRDGLLSVKEATQGITEHPRDSNPK